MQQFLVRGERTSTSREVLPSPSPIGTAVPLRHLKVTPRSDDHKSRNVRWSSVYNNFSTNYVRVSADACGSCRQSKAGNHEVGNIQLISTSSAAACSRGKPTDAVGRNLSLPGARSCVGSFSYSQKGSTCTKLIPNPGVDVGGYITRVSL